MIKDVFPHLLLPSMVFNTQMEVLPLEWHIGAYITCNPWQASLIFNGKQRGGQGRAWCMVLILLPDEGKSSSFQRNEPSGNLMGSSQASGSILLHPTFTVADIIYWFSTFLHQQDRTGKTTKHTGTKKLQCLLTDPSNTSPCEISPRKGPEVTQPLAWGKEFIP